MSDIQKGLKQQLIEHTQQLVARSGSYFITRVSCCT